MPAENPLVRVHVNIELPASALQAVVANTKKKTAAAAGGRHPMDTADALSALISKFLQENGFDAFAGDEKNY